LKNVYGQNHVRKHSLLKQTLKRKNIFMGIPKKDVEKRTDPRIAYSGHIFFATKSSLYEGEIKNYSKNGLFIKTQEKLTLGEFITVALPYVEDEQIKFQAQIMWRNTEGYGVELVKKRNDNDLRLNKIEAKLGHKTPR
jgi:Tfp pilus assembly protein PilZ